MILTKSRVERWLVVSFSLGVIEPLIMAMATLGSWTLWFTLTCHLRLCIKAWCTESMTFFPLEAILAEEWGTQLSFLYFFEVGQVVEESEFLFLMVTTTIVLILEVFTIVLETFLRKSGGTVAFLFTVSLILLILNPIIIQKHKNKEHINNRAMDKKTSA